MIKTYYSPEMFCKDHTLPPGLWKGQHVMNCVLGDNPEIMPFEMIDPELLYALHDEKMVSETLSLARRNGFGTQTQAHLNQILWACGSFYEATLGALRHGITFSPTSGFHHAKYNRASGYCTFNGLLLPLLHNEHLQVLILDGDAHFGDGVCDFLDRRPVFNNLTYLTTSAYDHPHQFIELAERQIRHYDLVMYQAGADCHAEDMFMCGDYSTTDFALRDKTIFSECKKAGVPIVWNLAGGYGAPTMKETIMLHYSTWHTALDIYKPELDRLLSTQGA